MTKRTEYGDDVVLYSNEEPIDLDETTIQDEYFSESELDVESWQDWYSQDLLNMYMSLVEYCETAPKNFLENISFPTFCTFISSYSK